LFNSDLVKFRVFFFKFHIFLPPFPPFFCGTRFSFFLLHICLCRFRNSRSFSHFLSLGSHHSPLRRCSLVTLFMEIPSTPAPPVRGLYPKKKPKIMLCFLTPPFPPPPKVSRGPVLKTLPFNADQFFWKLPLHQTSFVVYSGKAQSSTRFFPTRGLQGGVWLRNFLSLSRQFLPNPLVPQRSLGLSLGRTGQKNNKVYTCVPPLLLPSSLPCFFPPLTVPCHGSKLPFGITPFMVKPPFFFPLFFVSSKGPVLPKSFNLLLGVFRGPQLFAVVGILEYPVTPPLKFFWSLPLVARSLGILVSRCALLGKTHTPHSLTTGNPESPTFFFQFFSILLFHRCPRFPWGDPGFFFQPRNGDFLFSCVPDFFFPLPLFLALGT